MLVGLDDDPDGPVRSAMLPCWFEMTLAMLEANAVKEPSAV